MGIEAVQQLVYDTQAAITNWGKLLCATGGALKPEKCFWYLIWFVWKNGEWHYGDDPIEEYLTVPLPDGTAAGIRQVSVHVAMETLGMFTCTTGDCTTQLEKIQDRIATWTQRIRNGYLSQRAVWMSFTLQLFSLALRKRRTCT